MTEAVCNAYCAQHNFHFSSAHVSARNCPFLSASRWIFLLQLMRLRLDYSYEISYNRFNICFISACYDKLMLSSLSWSTACLTFKLVVSVQGGPLKTAQLCKVYFALILSIVFYLFYYDSNIETHYYTGIFSVSLLNMCIVLNNLCMNLHYHNSSVVQVLLAHPVCMCNDTCSLFIEDLHHAFNGNHKLCIFFTCYLCCH